MPSFRPYDIPGVKSRALAGAAIGGLSGGALGHYGYKNESKKQQKTHTHKGSIISGGLIGAYAGGLAGTGLGLRKALKDGYAGRGHYRGYYSQRRSYGPRAKTDHSQHLKTFGLSGSEKTKAEAARKYKEAAMKHHPDRPGGSEAKMKEINSAWHNIKNSSWFEKLSSPGFTQGFSLQTYFTK